MRRRSPYQPRSFRPAVSPLESRALTTLVGFSASAVPNVLTPPNNRYVRVTVTGDVSESSKKERPTVTLRTVDQYRQIEPQHLFKLKPSVLPTKHPTYTFRTTITLQAKRADETLGGRHYYLTVAAHDSTGSWGATLPVLVPHGLKPPPKVN